MRIRAHDVDPVARREVAPSTRLLTYVVLAGNCLFSTGFIHETDIVVPFWLH